MKVNLDDISKKVIYIDMDDTLCDYSGAHLSAKRLRPHIKFPQSEPGFFHELLPIPNAVKVMNLLLQSINYDPFILTAPSVMNPLCYTEKRTWVEQYLGMDYVNRLIISPRKELLIGDFLIDDYTHGKGQEFFKGEILHFGSDDIPDWSAIKSKLDL
ncbi:hypothetical protein CXF86_11650 [Shewanella sp. GutCb]|nr:hypothetical protein CXF86_11650 [Shewanella sp. GutCb]